MIQLYTATANGRVTSFKVWGRRFVFDEPVVVRAGDTASLYGQHTEGPWSAIFIGAADKRSRFFKDGKFSYEYQ